MVIELPLERVVERARSGEVGAFEVLYRETSPRIYALCVRLSGDRAAADGLLQEIFVRAWQRLDQFRGESRFTTWLHRLAVNVILEERRRRTRREDREKAWGGAEEQLAPPSARAHAAMDLERAISSLPERARTVFVLAAIEGYRHEEIAEVMNVSVGTSKAQLHRAKQLLREALNR